MRTEEPEQEREVVSTGRSTGGISICFRSMPVGEKGNRERETAQNNYLAAALKNKNKKKNHIYRDVAKSQDSHKLI